MSRLPAALPLVLALASAACGSLGGPRTDHIAFNLRNNLVIIPATVAGTEGEFVLSTAQPHSTLDDSFPVDDASGELPVVLGGRINASILADRADMASIADGILGADAFEGRTIGIDWKRGLLTLSSIPTDEEESVHGNFRGVPAVQVTIDGTTLQGLIDTATPDTLLLPAGEFGEEGRRTVNLRVGDHDLGTVDARVAPVNEVRIGNRILSLFLLTIDYRRGELSLWPYDTSGTARSEGVSKSRIGLGGANPFDS